MSPPLPFFYLPSFLVWWHNSSPMLRDGFFLTGCLTEPERTMTLGTYAPHLRAFKRHKRWRRPCHPPSRHVYLLIRIFRGKKRPMINHPMLRYTPPRLIIFHSSIHRNLAPRSTHSTGDIEFASLLIRSHNSSL